MAKNKVEVDIIIDDKGNMKKVARDANKAGAGLDKAGKSSDNYSKGQKGVAQATSNSTKAFAKMSGGMGGLVGAYATLAANVFAISAAFEFMKSAGNLQVLQSGQAAYAASTGIAIRTLTSDIMAATDAQLGFEDASQAAAIGLAAGLSSDQLVKLGKAAKDSSTVLGRDLTDSFNRLVRGATKAEPELLDELGIILRLDTATANYARSLGKTAKDLTAFERSQAVTNDILAQAEDKYGKMLEDTGTLSNSVTKLGKAFENDLLKPLKLFAAAVASPIFEFLSKNVLALGAALTLLALPIIKAIIPGLSGMTEAASGAADDARKHADEVKKASDERIRQLKQQQAELINTKKAAADYAKTTVAGLQAKKGSGLEALQKGEGVSPRQSQGMQRAIQANQGEYKKLTQMQRDDLVLKLKQMETATKNSTGVMQRHWSGMVTGFKSKVAAMKASWAGAMATMKSGAATMVKGVNKAMKGLALLGIILMVIDLAKVAYTAVRDIFRTDAQKEAAAAQERFNEKLEASIERARELSDELDKIRQGQLKSSVVGATEVAKAGLTAGNINKEDLLFRLTSGDVTAYKSARDELNKMATIMKDVKSTSLETDFAKFDFSEGATLESAKKFLALLSKIQEQGVAAEAFTKAVRNQSKAVTDLVNSYLPSTKFDEALAGVRAIQKAVKDGSLGGTTEGYKLNREERKELEKAVAQETILVALRDAKVKSAQNMLNIEIKQLQMGKGLTTLQEARLNASIGIEKTEESIRAKSEEIANFKAVIQMRDGIISDLEQVQLDTMGLQLLKLQQQEQVQRRQIDNQEQLAKAFRNAFESSTTTNIADLIKGNEKSFKDAFLKIAQGALSAVADKMAEQLSLKISDFIFKPSDPALTAQKENTTALQQLTSAITGTPTPVGTTSITSNPIAALGDKISGKFTSASEYLFGKKDGVIEEQQGSSSMVPGVYAKESEVRMGGVFSGFIASVQDLFAGDAPFLEGLGNVFKDGLGGFGTLFTDLLGGLFGEGGGMGFLSGLFGFGARSGGIMTPSGKVSGYSTGGVARGPGAGYPALLHGTEAVVPLPNGRSIPVEMQNGGGQTQNNVVVNVSADGSARTSESSGPDMDNLGAAIARAVQQELQAQKRSGGILNPYGVA